MVGAVDWRAGGGERGGGEAGHQARERDCCSVCEEPGGDVDALVLPRQRRRPGADV